MEYAAVAQKWSQEHFQSSSASRVVVEPHHGFLETLLGKEPLTLMTGQKIPLYWRSSSQSRGRDVRHNALQKMYKNEHVNSRELMCPPNLPK